MHWGERQGQRQVRPQRAPWGLQIAGLTLPWGRPHGTGGLRHRLGVAHVVLWQKRRLVTASHASLGRRPSAERRGCTKAGQCVSTPTDRALGMGPAKVDQGAEP